MASSNLKINITAVDKASKTLGGVGDKMKGLAVAGGALAGVAGLAVLTKEAAHLDLKMREVVTLFGDTGSAAGQSLGEVKSIVRSVSDEFGVAQESLTGGLYQAISAGVPKGNALEFMRVASQAATAGVTDVATSVDGLTSIINAFGLEAADAQRVSDSMFAAVKGGKTNFAQLSSSIFQIAPAAAAAKVSMEEVNAAIATMTAQGVPTSVATTQMRAALDGLQKPSENLDKIFGKLGFKNAQVAIESKGLAFALDAVKDASGGSNGQLQMLLGSTEAVSAANILAGSGAKKFAEEMARQGAAAGATSDAFGVIAESAEQKMTRALNRIKNVGLSLAQAILPVVAVVMDTFGNLGGAVSDLFSGFEDGPTAFAEAMSEMFGPDTFEGFETLGERILMVKDLITNTLIPAVKSLGGWLMDNKNVVAAVAVAFVALNAIMSLHAAVLAVQAVGGLKAYILQMGIVQAATRAWTAVQWLLNVALNANPIGIVVMAIAALVAAVVIAYKRSDTFRAIVDKALRAVGAAFVWLKNAAVAAFNWIKTKGFDFLVAVVKNSPLGLTVRGLFASFKWLRDNIGSAVQWVGEKFDSFVTFFKNLPSKFSAAKERVKDAIMSPFRLAFNAIATLWNNTVGRISFTAPNWIPGGIGGKSWSMPNVPTMAVGGKFLSDGLVYGHKGETITPARVVRGERGYGGGGAVNLHFHGPVYGGRQGVRELVSAMKAEGVRGLTA